MWRRRIGVWCEFPIGIEPMYAGGPEGKAELSIENVNDIMAQFPSWAKFRKNSTNALQNHIVEWMRGFINNTSADEGEAKEVVGSLKACINHFNYFEPQTATDANTYAELKAEAEEKVDVLAANLSIMSLLALAEDRDSAKYETCEFEAFLDALALDSLTDEHILCLTIIGDTFAMRIKGRLDTYNDAEE